jgi:hypothetical protein
MKEDFVSRLVNLLHEQATDRPNEYVNPHFLLEIRNLLENYYDIDDEIIGDYIANMWEF